MFGKDSFKKKNYGKYLLGMELGASAVQISYVKIGESSPETLSLREGMEEYNIPFALFREKEQGIWRFGKDALEKNEKVPGDLIVNLLDLCETGDEIKLGEETYAASALFALFVKRCFSLLSFVVSTDMIAGCTFTAPDLEEKKINILQNMTEYLQMPHIEFNFCTRKESFFAYNIHMEKELWNNEVYLYEVNKETLSSYCLTINCSTSPKVMTIHKKDYPLPLAENPVTQEEKKEADSWFLERLKEELEGKLVSTVYLIGDVFLGQWYTESLRYLCSKRRVFLGNNLFSKGACYRMMEHLMPSDLSKEYIYLGEDKLTFNMGIKVLSRGKEVFLPLLNGGNSWFESKGAWDFILEEENKLRFRIIPLDGKNAVDKDIILHGLDFKFPYCRIHLEVEMRSKDKMVIKIREKGFGEFSLPSGHYWEETMSI